MESTNTEQVRKELPKAQIVENFNWIVPKCCEEGWKSCKHVLKRDKINNKRNVGL